MRLNIEDRDFVIQSLTKAGVYVAKRLNSAARSIEGDFDVGFKIGNASVKCYLQESKLVVVSERTNFDGSVSSNRGELAYTDMSATRIGLAHYFAEAIRAVMRGR